MRCHTSKRSANAPAQLAFSPPNMHNGFGGRTEKKDSLASGNTRHYYYNDNWQLLCDYSTSTTLYRLFVYGNYIDEVLMINSSTGLTPAKLYVHDHLYSPAALLNRPTGAVCERYEYDAYGKCYILDGSYYPRSTSSYGNPFYFTGREMDFLDNANLKIMNYRHRYYDTYTGRFSTHDPLEYLDGMNLYEYARSNPVANSDLYGLMTEPGFSFKFISHYFFGRGGLWDKGADVVKRQPDVKEKISEELLRMAMVYCQQAVDAGGFVSGPFVRVLRGGYEQVYANRNVYMKWTLNGAEAYIMQGRYEAKACAYECPCTVKLNDVQHIWIDSGDLNLSRDIRGHFPDWLVWYATRIGIPAGAIAHYLGVFAIDFPVRIEWSADNRLWKKKTVGENFTIKTGWPWSLDERVETGTDFSP